MVDEAAPVQQPQHPATSDSSSAISADTTGEDEQKLLFSQTAESKEGPFVFEPSPEIIAMSKAKGLSLVVQTAVATLFTLFVLILPLAFTVIFINVSWTRVPLAGYVAFCYVDPAAKNGFGRRIRWVRSLSIWKYLNAYFPARIVLEQRLDPRHSYLFGVSPHGILCYTAQILMTSHQSGIDAAFEGLTLYTAALRPALIMPVFRDFLLAIGAIASSRHSIRECLARGNGHSVAIVVGGAKESLHTNRGSRKVVLLSRKGFVREAIMAGAPLVPVFAFGENDIFSQLESQALRRIQNWLQSKVKFALPVFYGRYGIIPHRIPLTVVVGAPISVEKHTDPSAQIIDSVHEKYVRELRRLYNKFRPVYDPLGDELVIALNRFIPKHASPLHKRYGAGAADPKHQKKPRAVSYVVYRVDTNGVEYSMDGEYQTSEEAEQVANKYESLGHKNGYFVRQKHSSSGPK
ncbi:2-acylglycerol O-acyltransferase 2 [Dipsacomyces acuminosporus]|nr:2-acylglycerol O-acyltransferase 2 [Dipsacomyces acuminosporus]